MRVISGNKHGRMSNLGMRGFSLLMLTLFGIGFGLGQDAQPPVKKPMIELLPLPNPDLAKMKDPIKSNLENYQKELLGWINTKDLPLNLLADAFGRMGEYYQAHSLLEPAEIMYINAGRLNPDEKSWPYYLGIIYEDRNVFEKAIEQFLRVLEINPNDLYAQARLGSMYLALNQPEKAGEYYARAYALDAEEPFVLHGLGMVAAAQNRPAEAVAYFEKLLALQPGADSVYYQLGLAHRKLGNREKMKAAMDQRGDGKVKFQDPHLAKLGNLVTESMLQVALAMAADLEHFSAKDYMGYIQTNFGSKPGLIEYFLAALEHKTFETENPNPLELAHLHYVIGNLMARDNELEEAETHYGHAITRAPDFIEPYLELGFLLRRQNQFTKAIPLYTRLLEKYPANDEALLGRAKAFAQVDLKRAAIVDLEKALTARPDKVNARVELATVLQDVGDVERAETEFETLLAMDLDDANKIFSYNSLALLHQRGGRHSRAAELYGASLQLDPRQWGVHLNLASSLAALDRFEQALPHYRQVVAAQPQNAAAFLGLAASLVLLDRLEEAKNQLAAAHKNLPDDLDIANVLARILAAAPDPALRDGAEAVRLAEAVFQRDRLFQYGETYAMALAQGGRFSEAVKLQEELLSLVRRENAPEDVLRLSRNLARYEARQTCCADYGHGLLLP